MESFQFYHYLLYKDNNTLIIHSDIVLKEKSFLQNEDFQVIQKQHLKRNLGIDDIVFVFVVEIFIVFLIMITTSLFLQLIPSNLIFLFIFLFFTFLGIYSGFLLSFCLSY